MRPFGKRRQERRRSLAGGGRGGVAGSGWFLRCFPHYSCVCGCGRSEKERRWLYGIGETREEEVTRQPSGFADSVDDEPPVRLDQGVVAEA
jgi:hypothetical protein